MNRKEEMVEIRGEILYNEIKSTLSQIEEGARTNTMKKMVKKIKAIEKYIKENIDNKSYTSSEKSKQAALYRSHHVEDLLEIAKNHEKYDSKNTTGFFKKIFKNNKNKKFSQQEINENFYHALEGVVPGGRSIISQREYEEVLMYQKNSIRDSLNYRLPPNFAEIRKNSRILAQAKRDQTNPLSKLPPNVLKLIAAKTGGEDISENEANKMAINSFKKPTKK